MFRTLCFLLFFAVCPLSSAITFPPPANIFRLDPEQGNGNLQLAVARNGMAFAIWTNFPDQVELHGAFFNPFLTDPITGRQGRWFPLQAPNSRIDFGSSPRVAIDKDGNATLVYVATTGVDNGQILVKRYNQQNLVLSQSIALSDPGTLNSAPIVAVNSDGSAIVVWIQSAPYAVLAKIFINVNLDTHCDPNVRGNGLVWLPRTRTQALIPRFLPLSPPGFNSPFGTYPANIGLSDVLFQPPPSTPIQLCPNPPPPPPIVFSGVVNFIGGRKSEVFATTFTISPTP